MLEIGITLLGLVGGIVLVYTALETGFIWRWVPRLLLAATMTPMLLITMPPPECKVSGPECQDWPFWLLTWLLAFGMLSLVAFMARTKRAAAPTPAVAARAAETPEYEPGGSHRTYVPKSEAAKKYPGYRRVTP